MTPTTLPPFPTDDATLAAVEHALGAALTYDRPEGAPDDGGPWVVGADFSLAKVLDAYAGVVGEDPNQEVIEPGIFPDDPPRMVFDTRPHYTERDVIAALIAEVRLLRGEG